MKYGLRILAIISLVILAGCTRINSSQMVQTVPNSLWGMAIFTNNTEVPQAGFRAMNITAGVLRSKGIQYIAFYPSNASCSKLIVCPNATPTVEQVLRWAYHKHLTYVMMGAVNEWDYKVGLDGEPIVGLSLQLYHVPSGKLIWSSVGSKIGTSRSGLAVIAQKLISGMLCTLKTW
jgi:hypothetical protein